MDISAKRGDILDRHGRVLAYSVDSDSVYGVPSEIDDAGKAASVLCRALADCAANERETLAARLRQKRAFVYVRRRVTPQQARRIAELDLEGIDFIKEDRRFYPKKELAAQLLGFVGIDNKGLAGIEAAYDSQISGALGKLLYQTDARGRAFSRLERPPTAGATVELTIDEYLQHVAERELREAVARNRAAGGTVIVMNPKTGEILALANEPTFNPNAFSSATVEQRRNRAVQDIYEPGSTFKVVTASAALEERVVASRRRHQRRRRKDPVRRPRHRRHARLRIADVHRCDREVEQRRRDQGRSVARSGAAGRLCAPFRFRARAVARLSGRDAGHRLGSREARQQRARLDVDGLPGRRHAAPDGGGGQLGRQRRRFDSAARRSCAHSRRQADRSEADGAGPDDLEGHRGDADGIMEQTVERGTATYAQVDGYTIAGKTGTAAKLVNGRYSTSFPAPARARRARRRGETPSSRCSCAMATSSRSASRRTGRAGRFDGSRGPCVLGDV